MPLYQARLINLGRVVAEQTFEAPDDTAAYAEAHPEKMDPCLQEKEAGVLWVEVTKLKED